MWEHWFVLVSWLFLLHALFWLGGSFLSSDGVFCWGSVIALVSVSMSDLLFFFCCWGFFFFVMMPKRIP
jgi:hypothetical protein